MERPPNVKHWKELLADKPAGYPGDDEPMTLSSEFSPVFGLFRFGVSHELLTPGRRSGYPHAERAEDEFVLVLEGTPDLWQDGHLYRLEPGDAVGWPAGTGVCHCLINNTEQDVRLLVVGEPTRKRYQVHYPLNEKQNEAEGEHWWREAPKRELGPHDGLPDARRARVPPSPLQGRGSG